MARSTFYYYLKRLSVPDRHTLAKDGIRRIYDLNRGRYGYRRITIEMKKLGYVINHKTVLKLMNQCGIRCMVRMKKYNSYKGEIGKIAPNLLERNFYAQAPNQKWVTDVTEFSLFGEKLYLSPIMDLFNSEIISYSISTRPTFEAVLNMAENAFKKIPNDTNLILHSDQGWQYQMNNYQQMLETKGIRQSMSRKGNCLDNAVIENFFGLLKSELLYLQKFDSMDKFVLELKDYIDYYNNVRIKTKLKGLSPIQFRTQSQLILIT